MSIHIRVPMLPGSGKEVWQANVNGEENEHLVESNSILLDVLRDQVGTLGVKRGCDMGTCGCCAVLIDGEPRLSCLCLAKEASGTEITTVEGLADGHHLHPIQQCFAEAGGSQCGFCTPGFLVVSAAQSSLMCSFQFCAVLGWSCMMFVYICCMLPGWVGGNSSSVC